MHLISEGALWPEGETLGNVLIRWSQSIIQFYSVMINEAEFCYASEIHLES